MLDPTCIYEKSIFAKCTRLVCPLSFASLFMHFITLPQTLPSQDLLSNVDIFWLKNAVVSHITPT